jgi:hypothetical protein
VKDFGGDVMAASLVPPALQEVAPIVVNGVPAGAGGGIGSGIFRVNAGANVAAYPGQVGGAVTDPSGAVVSGAHVTVTNSTTGFAEAAITNSAGQWAVSNFPTGVAKIRVEATGFKSMERAINYDAGRALITRSP